MSESAESAHSASPSVDSSRVNTITTPPVGTDGIDSDSAGSNTPIPSMMDVFGPNDMSPDPPEDDTSGLKSVQPTPFFLGGSSDINPTSSSTTSASDNSTSLGGHPPSIVPVDSPMPVEITGTPRGEVSSLPTSVADVVAKGGDPTQGPVPSGTNDPSMPSTMFPNDLSGFPTEVIVSSSSIPTVTPGEPIDATSSPHAFSSQTLGPAGSNDTTSPPRQQCQTSRALVPTVLVVAAVHPLQQKQMMAQHNFHRSLLKRQVLRLRQWIHRRSK